MMKKASVFLLAAVMLLSLTGCGNGHKKMIKQAIEETKHMWEHTYASLENETDGHFEIKNTRVITIKEDAPKQFQNVSYVIEFEIYSDYFASAPYYYSVDKHDQVIVYNDGKMEVPQNDIFKSYSISNKNNYDSEKIIDSIEDYGDKYNCVETLK